MKNSFFSFLFFGLFLTALISFADPQETNRKSDKRNNRTTTKDTSAVRRVQNNTNTPGMQKPDSPPIPKPAPPVPPPPVPRPDTINNGMVR
jgi:hypothetical protein